MILDTTDIITHDNIMNQIKSISQQLRQRRLEMNLSLSEVARRAGTSAATLSRYEHAWTRFETYTLRKLATALGCELRIELLPKETKRLPKVHGRTEARTRLGRLFWDHPLSDTDFEKHPVWLVERVLEYGNLEDIQVLREVMGKKAFLQAAAAAHRISPRTRNFWSQILELEGVSCTKKYSRNTAWNS